MADKTQYRPWKPAEYSKDVTFAAQALAAGSANAGQQKLFLKWLIEECCRTYDQAYIPDSDRDTAFALGMRTVGLTVVKLLNITSSIFDIDWTGVKKTIRDKAKG